MQKKNPIIILALLCAFSTNLQAQYAKNETTYKMCFIESTLFMGVILVLKIDLILCK